MSIWQTPAVVLVLLTWLASPATTLSEVARREALRRQLAAPAGRIYTNEDLPVFMVTEPQQAAAATAAQDPDKPSAAKPAEPPPAPAANPDAKHDEAWWRDRITTARKAVTTHQLLAEALQSRINGLTADWINRDDPAQKAQLFDQRQQAIAELDGMKKQLEADRKGIQDVLDDAKKNDVPAGWIR